MEERRHKIIIVFFGVIFILALSATHLSRTLKVRDLFAIQDNTKDVIARPRVEYKTEELRDPFWSPIEKEEVKDQRLQEQAPVKPLPTLIIQGIVWGGVFPQAIINNKVVKVGDTIEEVRIVDINKNNVTVFFDNREYNLSSPAAVNLQSLKREPKGGKYEYEE